MNVLIIVNPIFYPLVSIGHVGGWLNMSFTQRLQAMKSHTSPRKPGIAVDAVTRQDCVVSLWRMR